MTVRISQAGPGSLPADQPAHPPGGGMLSVGRPEENLRVLRHSEEER